MTPTTRLPLVKRLRHIVAEARRLDAEEADGVNFAPCLDDGHYDTLEEAAALIEKQGEVIADLADALDAIKRHGEMANIDKGGPHWGSGKKPPSMDAWAFPRHLLNEVDTALLAAKTLGERE